MYGTDQVWTVHVDDDDPSSTRVRSVAESRLERPGWSVMVRDDPGSLELAADAGAFQLTIELAALLDGTEFFCRRWVEDIPRQWA